MTSRIGGPPLLLRFLGSGVRATAMVGVIVLLSAFLVSAGPRALARLGDAELSYELGAVPEVSRALRSEGSGTLVTGPGVRPQSVDEVWGYIRRSLAMQRRYTVPPLLRRGLGTTITVVRAADVRVRTDADPAARDRELGIVADPDFASRVRWLRGSAPALWTYIAPDGGGGDESTASPMPIGLSAASASRMGLEVGSGLHVKGGRRFVVSGIYETLDPGALYWKAFPTLQRPGLRADSTDAPPTIVADAIVSAKTAGLAGGMNDTVFTALLPLSATAWRGEEAPTLLRDLRAMGITGLSIPSYGEYVASPANSAAVDAVDTAIGRIGTLGSIATIVGVPPVGILLLVLILAVGAMVAVRRPALELAAARGAPPLRLRGAVALEGAAIGVLAGVVGGVAGSAATGFRGDAAGNVLPVLVAFAPAIIGGALAAPDGSRRRADLGVRGGGRWARIAQAAVVALAAASLVLLLQRGATAAPPGADPLLSIAPLLLAATVGLAVVHLYPLPLRLAQRLLRRGRGMVGFLGAARGIRSPVVGLTAVLAIVVGVAVGVFPSVLLTTLDRAARAVPRAELGADIRADLPYGATIPRSASAVPGLATLATLAPQGPASLGDTQADLVTATAVALHRIQPAVPAGMSRLHGGAIPILASPDLHLRTGARTRLAERPAVVVGTIPDTVDPTGPQHWVIADAVFAPRLVRVVSRPTALLADVEPGASASAVASRLRVALGNGTTVQDAETDYRELERSPSIRGVAATTLIGAVVAMAVAVLCAVLSMVGASAIRERTLGTLRILGLSRRQAGRLVAAELVPVSIVSVVAGTLLGVGLAVLIRATVDLRSFTGGSEQPALALDPVPVALLLGGFLAATAIAGLAVGILTALRPTATPDRMGAT